MLVRADLETMGLIGQSLRPPCAKGWFAVLIVAFIASIVPGKLTP